MPEAESWMPQALVEEYAKEIREGRFIGKYPNGMYGPVVSDIDAMMWLHRAYVDGYEAGKKAS